MPPALTPLAVGRVTDGFPEGWPDMMMTASKNERGLRRGHYGVFPYAYGYLGCCRCYIGRQSRLKSVNLSKVK